MTGGLFAGWIKNLDAQMQKVGHMILLLIDNAPGHVEEGLTLTNIVIKFLLPNTTSHLQPLDAGIIQSFKAQYCKLHIQWLIECYEEGEPNA